MRRGVLVWFACLALASRVTVVRAEEAPEALTLEQAHAVALQNHPGIAAANDRALASTEVFKQTRAGLLPQVTAFGSGSRASAANTRIVTGALGSPRVFDRSAVGASANQLITDFGKTSNLVASSKLQASAANQQMMATRQQVLLEVDGSYFSVLRAQALESVARQTVDTRKLLLDRVTVLAANKLKSDLDVSFARVAVEDANLLLQQAQNDVDSAMASLSANLGFRDLHPFELVEQAPEPIASESDLPALIERAVRERPELGSLRDEHDAAERLARSMRDARFPTVSAVITAGDLPTHETSLSDNYSAGGIELTVPLFAGGYYVSKQREAELRAKAAAESLRSLEDEVVRDVRIAWLDLNNARERLRTTQQLSRYASEAYQLADARYKTGISSIVELSQAQLELTSAQIAETTSRYEVLLQESALRYQIGAMLGSSSRGGGAD